MKHEEPVKTKSPSLKVSEDNLIDLDFDTDPRPSISQSATASISNDYDRPDLDDRFELLEPIGEGAMAYVWKVRDKSIDQILALKLLRKELTQDPEAVSRFQQEARLTMQLEHPHIAAVYEPGNDKNGRPYILMDFVPGETLQQLLAREGKLTEERALGIFEQICQALSYAHMHGIVHRDIKPSNIMIDSTESGADFVKVVDFGIARSIHEEVHNTQALTRPLGDFATPRYMSPEQCLGQEITPQSDIYSLGCVLFEMISGAPPFTETNQVRLILQHLNDNPDLTKFSPKVASILFFSLAKVRDERIDKVDLFLAETKPLENSQTNFDFTAIALKPVATIIQIATFSIATITASHFEGKILGFLMFYLLLIYLIPFAAVAQKFHSSNSKLYTFAITQASNSFFAIALLLISFFAHKLEWRLILCLSYITIALTSTYSPLAQRLFSKHLFNRHANLKKVYTQAQNLDKKILIATGIAFAFIICVVTITVGHILIFSTIPASIYKIIIGIVATSYLFAIALLWIFKRFRITKISYRQVILTVSFLISASAVGLIPIIVMRTFPNTFLNFESRYETASYLIFHDTTERMQSLLEPEASRDYKTLTKDKDRFDNILAQYAIVQNEVAKGLTGSEKFNFAIDTILGSLEAHFPKAAASPQSWHMHSLQKFSGAPDLRSLCPKYAMVDSTWVLYQIMDFTNSSDDLRFDRARKLLEIHKPKDQNLQREIQNLIDLHEKKIQP
ncbi:MAG: serine/threonine protein kinase [Candidatus Obscuribacterales bacterium]|nr:serine/threonine protein kinase [Candidatus Obscuribacterales bacterium]